MTDFVLVHGAWGGGFTFDPLVRALEAQGHRALVCELTGLGARKAELHPGITLTTHVDDVCDQIEKSDFDRFVLAGHSYGGMVITAVATRLGAQIDGLAYLDAFLPRDGESLWDITGKYEHDWYIDTQKFTPGLVAPIAGVELLDNPRYGRQPLLTLTEAVRFTGEEAKPARRGYLFATGWEPTPFRRFADVVKGDPDWLYREADCGHNVMSEATDQSLELLMSLAE